MKQWVFGLGLCLLASSASGQTLLERATLARDAEFQARVGMAAMQTAIAVSVEAPETTDHAVRMKLAVWAIVEPEVLARKLAVLAASVTGVTSAATDADLKALLAANWTLVAQLFTTARTGG